MFCLHCGDGVARDGNTFTHNHGIPADGHNPCPYQINPANWTGREYPDTVSPSTH